MMDVLVDGKIVLEAPVGGDFFTDGFTSMDVVLALSQVRGKDIEVYINSGGGYTHEGVAIYNHLKAHKGKKTIYVTGVAASAASVILAAGDERIMYNGATVMVHDPMVFTEGNIEEHKRSLKYLEVTADSIADIYADMTGRDWQDVRDEMSAETWMSADDAVAKGYATKLDKSKKAKRATAFAYNEYKKAPSMMVTLASQNGWRLKAKATTSNPPITTETENMTEEEKAAQVKANKDAIDKATADATAAATASATQASLAIMEECTKAGMPGLATSLIKEGLSLDQAKLRIVERQATAKDIRAAVASARKVSSSIKESVADDYIQQGLSLDQARSKLFDAMSTNSDNNETFSSHQSGNNGNGNQGGQASAKAGWKRHTDAINSRRGFAA